jgi:hypothetical protein
MRPSLSPLEYGAYGTPSRVVSLEVGGPHESSEGRAEMISDSEIGAMITTDRESRYSWRFMGCTGLKFLVVDIDFANKCESSWGEILALKPEALTLVVS